MGCPQIIYFKRILHYKPASYWGTPIAGNQDTQRTSVPNRFLCGRHLDVEVVHLTGADLVVFRENRAGNIGKPIISAGKHWKTHHFCGKTLENYIINSL